MRRLLPSLVLVLVANSIVRGEVSITTPDGPTGITILASIVDHPDPLGFWLPIRPLPAIQILNASGDARGDGRPDIATAPTSRYPSVTWAYNAGGDFDIAFAEWDGIQWSPTEFLTATTTDQLDPRVWIQADGAVHVVWWEAGATGTVFLRTRPAGGTLWDATIQVSETGTSARRPAVTVYNGVLQIAYEQDSTVSGMAQDVIVAKDTGGGFARSIVYSTARTEPLDTVIHAQGPALWLDWKDDGNVLGCATWSGSWSIDAPEPWPDPSWVGVEVTRRAIRDRAVP